MESMDTTVACVLRRRGDEYLESVDASYLSNILDNMNAITYSYAREKLSSTITDVCLNHDPIIITKKGTDAVVMISLEDFELMQETTYLLKSPKNAKRLLEAIEQLTAGKGTPRELSE
jgi:antitoxin YefM